MRLPDNLVIWAQESQPDPPEVQLRQQMECAGIEPPASIIIDGNLHRFSTGPTGKDDAGWYVVYPDGVPAGKFGDWRTGTEINFRADIGRQLSAAEEMAIIRRMSEAKARRDEAKDRERKIAAGVVDTIWSDCTPASKDHPYLSRKGIGPNGARVTGDGRLVVPLTDTVDGAVQLHSLQYISEDGKKLYHAGGRTGGMYWLIGDSSSEKTDTIYIAEGFATGATILEEVGQAVAIAYSAGNIEPVTGKIRALYPTKKIVIVADNDASQVGQRYAEQAAAKHGAIVVIPPIAGDANDYKKSGHNLHELLCPNSRLKEIWGDSLGEEYEAPDEIVEGLFTSKSLAVVYGNSNSGKTFWALSVAACLSEGVECYGRQTDKGIVVYLATEAPGSIRSRMQALKKFYGCSLSGLVMVPNPLNLYSNARDALDVIDLVRDIEKRKGQKVKMIIADTLARMSAGANENSGEDMGPIMERFSLISAETGANVLIVHHSGKDAARGMRGWSGLLAHVETEIEVTEKDEAKTATVTKQRELPTKGLEIPFYLQVIEMGTSKFGEKATTCVAVPDTGERRKEKSKTVRNHIKTITDAFWWQADKADKVEFKDGNPYVSTSKIVRYLVEVEGKKEAAARKSVMNLEGRMCGILVKEGVIQEFDHGFIFVDDDEVSRINLLFGDIK